MDHAPLFFYLRRALYISLTARNSDDLLGNVGRARRIHDCLDLLGIPEFDSDGRGWFMVTCRVIVEVVVKRIANDTVVLSALMISIRLRFPAGCRCPSC